MKMRRRMVLKGLGGLTLGLPVLEGLLRSDKTAHAGEVIVPPYAIFLRQANGCGSQQDTKVGAEPERFWPTQQGPLNATTLAGRALEELIDHAGSLLAVGVNGEWFDYGDGHANGVMQGLTAQGPVTPALGGDSEANGESIDHRIGRELNPDGRDSLVLFAGTNSGWLGGACQSYRGPGNRRAPLHNPWTAYQTIMGIDGGTISPELIQRRKSVNDLVRDQMDSLLNSSALSSADVQRLELHRAAIRDLEDSLACNLTADEEMMLEGGTAGYDGNDGNLVLNAVRLHMDVAALAVACGYTRAVSIQVGNGNDGNTRYWDQDTGQQMENYHFISHRRLSHDSSGTVIPDSDLLHHKIDRQFAQTFKYLLDKLAAYPVPTGSLLDAGVSIWHNDNGQGPSHTTMNRPYIMAGSASGYFKQGEYIRADSPSTHCRLLNMIGTAVGLRNASGGDLDDFGDASLPKDPIPELRA